MGLRGLPTRTSTVKRGMMVRLFFGLASALALALAWVKMGWEERRMKGVRMVVRRRWRGCIFGGGFWGIERRGEGDLKIS